MITYLGKTFQTIVKCILFYYFIFTCDGRFLIIKYTYLFYYYLCHVLLWETTFVKWFWLILNLTGGPYPCRIVGRFGVWPTNIWLGRVLGLRPGHAGRVLGHTAYHTSFRCFSSRFCVCSLAHNFWLARFAVSRLWTAEIHVLTSTLREFPITGILCLATT